MQSMGQRSLTALQNIPFPSREQYGLSLKALLENTIHEAKEPGVEIQQSTVKQLIWSEARAFWISISQMGRWFEQRMLFSPLVTSAPLRTQNFDAIPGTFDVLGLSRS